MIYLASPYSHPDAVVRNLRYERVLFHCAEQMRAGKVIFSPIVYGHQFALLGLAQTDHVWWKEFNERMMAGSEALHVLMLEGWHESNGVSHEINFAHEIGLEVKFV